MCTWRLCIFFLVPMLLGGCSGAWNGEPNFQSAILLPATPSTSQAVQDAVPDVCKNLLNATPSGPVDAPARNGCIFAMMSLIDQSFYEYRKSVRGLVDTGNAATDIIGIGVSSAATLVPGATTKSILSAINTSLAGAKAKIDSDVLYSKSVSLILTQMDADRADWKSRILAQINDPLKSSAYTMYQASVDLLSYYQAGTWDHALTSLDTQASSNLNNCQAAVKSAQTAATSPASGPCGPQQAQVVTVVSADLQKHREALAAYVKTLSATDLDKLAQAVGTPTGANALVGILLKISAATTAQQVDAIAAQIKSLFGKDI
jgi:hypothetical protein